jgi:hypothetical protein
MGIADIPGRVQVWARWTRRTKASVDASWQRADCRTRENAEGFLCL